VRSSLAVAAVALLGSAPAVGQRHLDGHRLRSDSLPRAVFTFDSTLTYLGTQSFILYDVARAEQHFFGELDGKRLKRFVWVQFEGDLPDNAHTYDYSRFPTVLVSGRAFHHNETIRVSDGTAPRPGSDGARMWDFLKVRGYTLGSALLYQRLVWLLDQPARNEVMVIYMEDLDGVPAQRRQALLAQLPGRATRVFRITDQ
jgi:hypothetical protein